MQALAEILRRQSQHFSRAAGDKRGALRIAFLAINAYLLHRLPRTPTMLDVAVTALLDAEKGIGNPLFRPDPGKGRKATAHAENIKMALAVAAMDVLMDGGSNKAEALKRVARAAGCPIQQIDSWRDKRLPEREDWVRDYHKTLVREAERRIAAGRPRAEIVAGMLAALEKSESPARDDGINSESPPSILAALPPQRRSGSETLRSPRTALRRRRHPREASEPLIDLNLIPTNSPAPEGNRRGKISRQDLAPKVSLSSP